MKYDSTKPKVLELDIIFSHSEGLDNRESNTFEK